MIALPTFRGFLGGIDSDVATFAAATGATDLGKLSALAGYLKAQSLWTHCRFFPFKSTQNFPTGTTVKGLGGWTSNEISLFGSVANPTTAGRAFDATDDRGTWNGTDIQNLSELYIFDRQAPVAASGANVQSFGMCSFGESVSPSILYNLTSTGALTGETASCGITSAGPTIRWFGSSEPSWSAGDGTQIVTRFAATGFALWQSKAAKAIDKTAGTQNFAPSETGWTTDSIVNINCRRGAALGLFTATTRIALLFCKTALTQSQREAITDYLDAL